MTPDYTKVHNRFRLNGHYFSAETLNDLAYGYIKEGEDFEIAIGNFLLDWLDEKSYVEVNTSGSTGVPKPIKLSKQAMVYSAIATGDYFKLLPGNSALLCLSANFIAGKMMLVRAIILGLELDIVSPTSRPLEGIKRKYDFSAMVPMQLQESLDEIDKIKTLIVGGAAVSAQLQAQLMNSSCRIYATYGMTETITHIAVKQLNGVKEGTNFEVLPNVKISVDDRSCLVIDAERLSKTSIVTNDVVELCSETSFKLLGRYDNIINSGGIKLFPESIENKLATVIDNRFFVSSQSDSTLGECLVLVVEAKVLDKDDLLSSIKKMQTLQKYEVPKYIYNVSAFIETNSGKIQRKKTLDLLKKTA